MNCVNLTGKIANKKDGTPNVICFTNDSCHNWRVCLQVRDDFPSRQPVFKNGQQVFNTDGTPATELRHGLTFVDLEIPVFADKATGEFRGDELLMKLYNGEVDVVSIRGQMANSSYTDKKTGEICYKQVVRVPTTRDITVESWAPRTEAPALRVAA